jgi:hypothetical protein
MGQVMELQGKEHEIVLKRMRTTLTKDYQLQM